MKGLKLVAILVVIVLIGAFACACALMDDVYVVESGIIGPLKIADALKAMPQLPGGSIVIPSNS